MRIYRPRDVFNFASNGDIARLTKALTISSNRGNWYLKNGRNALHAAAVSGHLSCANILLNSGIDVNSRTTQNDSALSLATSFYRLECMELLLARGADINYRYDEIQTTLHHAAMFGHEECVWLLLDAGAAIDEDDIDSYKPLSHQDFTDCRPLIIYEIENRRNRTAYDTFIHHHIEYRPCINQ